MHKIERLLHTLAPKGVEFRKLGEIGEFTRGNGLLKSDLQDKGRPVVHYGQIHTQYNLSIDKTISYVNEALFHKLKKAKPNDILIATTSENVKDVGKSIAWLGNEEVAFSGEMYSYSTNENPKFIIYYFQTYFFQKEKEKKITGTKVMRIHENDLKKITIPIPPLEIQQEIVKILDAFTELNAELNARKKQYKYYQNMLLDFNDINQSRKDAKERLARKTYPKRLKALLQTLAPDGVEFKTLEEVFEIRNGYTPSKNNPEFWKNGTIPWFRMEDLRENGRILKDSIQHITPKALKGKKLFPKNSIIISTTATIGEHALLIVESLANQQFTFLSKKANCDIALDMKFFFYQCFLLGEWCKNNTNVSGFASVDMTAFKKYKFPIPPLEIQQEIVTILDQFSALTTDLQAGIPAEIKARKKQYEYYREKLLAFKPLTPQRS
ncbi:restriction endonuclease subunit S [Helicobacter pylori]|uniref:restriction endonuclease subunit S n=1 Tax=Helicobacter pylori TaxID=210 RepID=UPI00165AA471|nr:restriction endonuclease subunit S [Helicobacter pylori]